MSYVSRDKNYTDPAQSGVNAADRVGNAEDRPENETTDRDKAAKMANLLEGLEFPASKEDIKNHLNRKSPSMGNRINDVFEAVQNNLDDAATFSSVYEIEKAAGLVESRRSDSRW
jgi:hypothetical protein